MLALVKVKEAVIREKVLCLAKVQVLVWLKSGIKRGGDGSFFLPQAKSDSLLASSPHMLTLDRFERLRL